MKHIIIAGGTGYLGQSLESYFKGQGHQVSIFTRNPIADNHIHWDAINIGPWASSIPNCDVIINLTGKSVDCRYSKSNKKAIRQSRICSTRVLHKAIHQCTAKPKLFINASTATIYKAAQKQLMTEAEGIIGDDFSMNVAKDWEASFFEAKHKRVRQVALRTSIVLGHLSKGSKDTGALTKLKLITQLGLGGHQGSGQQKVSWIHIEDFCRAVNYIIENKVLIGPINVTAPQPVTNFTLMKTLRDIIKPLFYFNQPKALLEAGAWLLSTETELLLKSRNVYPELLLESGFKFNYPFLNEALNQILNQN